MEITVDCLPVEVQITLLKELSESLDVENLIKGLDAMTISDIVNALDIIKLDDVIIGFNDCVKSIIKENCYNEIDCAMFLDTSDSYDMQTIIDNLTEDTCKLLFKKLNNRLNPNA